MKKRLQIALSDEAWEAVECLSNNANKDFDTGHISYSDAINEMVICSKVDIKKLQLKHTNLRRTLRALASKGDVDLDFVLSQLSHFKLQNIKKKSKTIIENEVSE